MAALLLAPLQTKAESGDLQFGGLPWAVYTYLHEVIIGQTTVIPSYDLYTWDLTDSNWLFYSKSHHHLKYKFDFYARRQFYTETWTYDNSPNSTPSTNNTPFQLTGVGFVSYYCNRPLYDAGGNPVGGIGESKAQNYSIVMTCRTTTTGMSPPTGPFDISFKTAGPRLAKDCTSTVSGKGYWDYREFRKTFSVMPYGFETGRIGWVNYSLAWPFQCWAGPTYLY